MNENNDIIESPFKEIDISRKIDTSKKSNIDDSLISGGISQG